MWMFLIVLAASAWPVDGAPPVIRKDVPYLGTDRAEKGDLYLPPVDSTKPRPAVVIIHGGGWTSGDKGAKREINIGTTLANAGYVCLSINYRLQTKDGPPAWPGNLHDCKVAVRYLRVHANDLNIDIKNIGVIGGSAGGHLAAMVGLTGDNKTLDPVGPYSGVSTRVQAVVDMYGPMADDSKRLERLVPIVGATFSNKPDAFRAFSPLNHIDASDPPVLILHGTADTTVDVADSERFAAALKKAGTRHELVIIPGAPHTFDLQPKQRDLRPLVLEFFGKYLKN
ncbi:MAG: alpha/beta fold hydrolase [Planctomycetota bacterium]